MLTRFCASGLLTFALIAPTQAQTARVTGDPSTVSLPNGTFSPLSVDNQGRLWLANPGSAGGGGGSTGSVTAPGTSGTSAQAVQGITGGVPVAVTSAAPGTMEQDVRASGTLNAATANAAIVIPVNGQSTVGLTFTGLTASGATVTYEQSNDAGTTWTGVNEVNAGTGAPSPTRSTDGQTRVAVQGRTTLRIRVSTTGTGTITVASNVSVREGLVTLASPLPPGTNAIGGVTVSNFPASQAVTGAFFQATQPISAASLPLPAGAATAANQAAPGTAGSPSTQVLTVQGISGGTSQPATLTTGSANIGSLGVTTVSGGVTGFSRIASSSATTNATSAKTAQGRLYKVFACNTSTSPTYIRFYNLAAAPTVGTSTVLFSRPIPPAGAAGGIACASYDMNDIGWFFSTGIAYAITAGAADNDTTALTAGQVVQVSVEYQ